jgi:hypothetical protein
MTRIEGTTPSPGRTHDLLADHPLLEMMLPVAVLIALEEIAQLTDTERERRASESATTIGSHGDDLMFGGRHTSDAFAALARALAVLAHQPGGVTFAGLHWCVGSGHHGTREQAPCAAEFAREQAHSTPRPRQTPPSSRSVSTPCLPSARGRLR